MTTTPAASSASHTGSPAVHPLPNASQLAEARAFLEGLRADLNQRVAQASASDPPQSNPQHLSEARAFLDSAFAELEDVEALVAAQARGAPATAHVTPKETPAPANASQGPRTPETGPNPPRTPGATPAGSIPGGFVPMDVGAMSRAELEQMFAKANPGDPRYDRAWAEAQFHAANAQLAQRLQTARQAAADEAAATEADSAEAYPRERGKFTLGNPGGPGRPRKPRNIRRDMATIVANRISDEALERMTDTAVVQAIQGSNAARRWLYQITFKDKLLDDAAAAAASGLSDDALRLELARERHGKAMDAAAAAQAEIEALEARVATAPAQPSAAPAEPPGVPAQASAVAAHPAQQAPAPGTVVDRQPSLAKVVTAPAPAAVGPDVAPAITRDAVQAPLAPRPETVRNEPQRREPDRPASDSTDGKNENKRSKTVRNGRPTPAIA